MKMTGGLTPDESDEHHFKSIDYMITNTVEAPWRIAKEVARRML